MVEGYQKNLIFVKEIWRMIKAKNKVLNVKEKQLEKDKGVTHLMITKISNKFDRMFPRVTR